ncbi:MAG: SPOR domain-containing protein [Candidatus Sumerlaeaceae bacterium]|nr:SPOR domain-containing protein [Candidatus Sumerlaeaceae bacterium]
MNSVFSQEMILLVGWTLVHFLWQGVAVAAVASGLLWVAARGSANLRYLIACAALAVMALCPPITAIYMSSQTAAAIPTEEHLNLDAPSQPAPLFTDAAAPAVSQPNSPVPLPTVAEPAWTMEKLLPALVILWMAGILVLSCRLVFGLAGIRRVRAHGVQPANRELLELVSRLAKLMAVSRPVQLMVSGLARVPVTIGALKPVILLPASALTGLSPREIELILAHELAHIRRHDYLANLLQSLVETVLFYHPAIWYVSHVMRMEREHCCDDIAVTVCSGDSVSLARALVRLEESRPTGGVFAISARGGSLLHRIQRLAGYQHQPERSSLKWAAGLIAPLVIIGVIVMGSLTGHAQDESNKPGVSAGDQQNSPDSMEHHQVPDETTAQATNGNGVLPAGYSLSTDPKGRMEYSFDDNNNLVSVTASGDAVLSSPKGITYGEKIVISNGRNGRTMAAVHGTTSIPALVVFQSEKLSTQSSELQRELRPAVAQDFIEKGPVGSEYLITFDEFDSPAEFEETSASLQAEGFEPIHRLPGGAIGLGPYKDIHQAAAVHDNVRKQGYKRTRVRPIPPGEPFAITAAQTIRIDPSFIMTTGPGGEIRYKFDDAKEVVSVTATGDVVLSSTKGIVQGDSITITPKDGRITTKDKDGGATISQDDNATRLFKALPPLGFKGSNGLESPQPFDNTSRIIQRARKANELFQKSENPGGDTSSNPFISPPVKPPSGPVGKTLPRLPRTATKPTAPLSDSDYFVVLDDPLEPHDNEELRASLRRDGYTPLHRMKSGGIALGPFQEEQTATAALEEIMAAGYANAKTAQGLTNDITLEAPVNLSELQPPTKLEPLTTPKSSMAVVKTLNVDGELTFRDLRIRITRINENDPKDKNDDSVEMVVRAPNISKDRTISEFRSEFVGDYQINVIAVTPQTAENKAMVQLEVRYNPSEDTHTDIGRQSVTSMLSLMQQSQFWDLKVQLVGLELPRKASTPRAASFYIVSKAGEHDIRLSVGESTDFAGYKMTLLDVRDAQTAKAPLKIARFTIRHLPSNDAVQQKDSETGGSTNASMPSTTGMGTRGTDNTDLESDASQPVPASITKTLKVEGVLSFRDLRIRVVKIDGNDPKNKNDDAVTLIVRTPTTSEEQIISEFRSETIGDYEINIIEVSPGQPASEGTVRLEVRWNPDLETVNQEGAADRMVRARQAAAAAEGKRQYGGPYFVLVASSVSKAEAASVTRQLVDDGYLYVWSIDEDNGQVSVIVCNFATEAAAATQLGALRSKGYQFGSVGSGKIVRKWPTENYPFKDRQIE